MRLIEPLGLLYGHAARDAVAAGLAQALAGDRMAYTLARLIESDGSAHLIAAGSLPDGWQPEAAALARAPPDWAGLNHAGVAVMGILNATPDSFSDGRDHLDPGRAVAAGIEMAAAGATLLDVGGESTRPGATPVAPEQEQARILPIIRALDELGVAISVDTRNAVTMAAALDAGARIVNDVSALEHDPDAPPLLARRDCPVVLMHMRGTPETMGDLANYDDVARDVTLELAARIAAAEAAGIERERIAVDPGIGFAKHERHSRELLRRLPILLNLGCRIVVGVSRKGLIGRIAGVEAPKLRLPGSLAAGLAAVAGGASVLRVHDVAATVQAVRVHEALCGQL